MLDPIDGRLRNCSRSVTDNVIERDPRNQGVDEDTVECLSCSSQSFKPDRLIGFRSLDLVNALTCDPHPTTDIRS